MNTQDPSDIAPLSYGAGLTLGLMLILGLPAEKKTTPTPATRTPRACESKLAEAVHTVPATLRL